MQLFKEKCIVQWDFVSHNKYNKCSVWNTLMYKKEMKFYFIHISSPYVYMYLMNTYSVYLGKICI